VEIAPGVHQFQVNKDWENLDIFETNGKLKILPTQFWLNQGFLTYRSMLHFKAQYFLPTIEALDAIKGLIKDVSLDDCMEIGAGNGWLGYALGIKMIDNYRQAGVEIMLAYLANGQPIIKYGEDVEKLDALSAVEKYKPHTVIGSWISQKSDITLPDGVDDVLMLSKVKRYILIGSDNVHGANRIMKIKHQKIKLPSLLSRTRRQEENSIWIWSR